MNKIIFSSEDERKYALACLTFAKRMSLISDDSLDAVYDRCNKENENRKKKLENNEIVYGPVFLSPIEYLDYELTRFKLDFVSESDRVNYDFKPIAKKDMKAYYKANKDLFTRYNRERFFFFEVKTVIYKKIREEEYENEINDILRQLS